FEARGLRDEPIGQVAAVAVATDREVICVGDAVFHQRVNALQNVAARPGKDLGNDAESEFVAIADGASVVGLEDQPALCGGQSLPVVPVGGEVVAVGIGWSAGNHGGQFSGLGAG